MRATPAAPVRCSWMAILSLPDRGGSTIWASRLNTALTLRRVISDCALGMKRQIVILALVVAVFAGLALKFFLRPNPYNSALGARELATRVLAEHLAGKYAGRHVLIVSNPFATKKETARQIV